MAVDEELPVGGGDLDLGQRLAQVGVAHGQDQEPGVPRVPVADELHRVLAHVHEVVDVPRQLHRAGHHRVVEVGGVHGLHPLVGDGEDAVLVGESAAYPALGVDETPEGEVRLVEGDELHPALVVPHAAGLVLGLALVGHEDEPQRVEDLEHLVVVVGLLGHPAPGPAEDLPVEERRVVQVGDVEEGHGELPAAVGVVMAEGDQVVAPGDDVVNPPGHGHRAALERVRRVREVDHEEGVDALGGHHVGPGPIEAHRGEGLGVGELEDGVAQRREGAALAHLEGVDLRGEPAAPVRGGDHAEHAGGGVEHPPVADHPRLLDEPAEGDLPGRVGDVDVLHPGVVGPLAGAVVVAPVRGRPRQWRSGPRRRGCRSRC